MSGFRGGVMTAVIKLEQPDKPDALLSCLDDRKTIMAIEDVQKEEDCEDWDYQQGLKTGYDRALMEMISAYRLVLNFRKAGI
jgi:hypothetical protein